MSDVHTGAAVPAARRRSSGDWLAPLLVAVAVALLASGLFSADPEPEPTTSPMGPISIRDDPGLALVPLTDDQGDFVEFGFDGEYGAISPLRESAGEVPVRLPGLPAAPRSPI